ncbi:nuclear-interacting partner of ALK [Galendromus occidentalis]|uniref:Nuclear-interacting partner of ALK n=1 Tax=Galendromus occidentalis TaxID=34638 RepID=A0AAJ7L426_9ACAR|nr:nuclear-interacting partner of ALK [Galendromus occidentalis]
MMGLSCSTEVKSPLKCTSMNRIESTSTPPEGQEESENADVIDLIKLSEGDSADFDKFSARIATFFNDEGVNHHWLSKPQSLSPPNCAIFGWRLTSCNMLTCELCGAKLYAEVSAKLPPHTARKCLKELERNLRSGHTKGCTYRFAPSPEEFKFVSSKAASTLIEEFQKRLQSLKVLADDLPSVTLDEFEYLDQVKRDSDLKDTPSELVILALMGWEHHSTAYNKFVFIRCGYCFRKVCTMFYRKLTREEELLVEEAEQRMREESKDSSPNSSNPEETQTVPGSTERKRRGSKDILETKLTSSKKKRKPQDQLNPAFEHRSWCAWISKPSHDSPVGWKVLLQLLISHNERIQSSRSPQKVSHEAAIDAADKAVENIRRKSDHWKGRILQGDKDQLIEPVRSSNQETSVVSSPSS